MQSVMPEIQSCEYHGQKVLSTTQISVVFNCKRQNITDIFRRHKKEFVEGTDYFLLKGAELYKFKVENGILEEDDGNCTVDDKSCNIAGENVETCLAGNKSACTPIRPISKTVNRAFLFTESGFFKFSKFVNTARANTAFQKMVVSYFLKKATQNFNPPVNNPVRLPKVKKPKIKDSLTFEQLQFLISNCTDSKLRDNLIRKAAGNLEMPKCVYILLLENDLLKIGITQNFQRRAREIITQTDLNVKNWCHTNYLSPEFARDIEINLQEIFRDFQVDGEFFTIDFDTAVEKLSDIEEITEFQTIQ